MRSDARVGVYYCPREDDSLFVAGATWLGRDPRSGVSAPQPALVGIEEVTADARLYGFHATLKPPMRLADGRGWDEFLTAAYALAGRIAPFQLPALVVANLHGFLALREASFCAPLRALADACVVDLDRFRASPSAAELARRRRARLTEEQDAMLIRYGYPYVLDTWFFHMTLTRRLTAGEHAFWRPKTDRFFEAATRHERDVTDICLFKQTAPGQPFVIAERIPLRG